MLLYRTTLLLSESLPRQLAPTVGRGVYRAMMQMVFLQSSTTNQLPSPKKLAARALVIAPFVQTKGSGKYLDLVFLQYII